MPKAKFGSLAATAFYFVLLASSSSFAQNNYAVLQEVELTVGDATYKEQHLWYLTSRNFRLQITAKNHEIIYVTSGRNLLACLKTDRSLSLNREDNSTLPGAVSQALTTGICVVPSTNVMVSFFLSPVTAATMLHLDESLRLNLTLDQLTHTPQTSTNPQTKDKGCGVSGLNYAYRFVRDETVVLQHRGQEQLCHDPNLQWRHPLWTLVSRRLIQQGAAGLALRNEIEKQDLQNIGLATEATASYAMKTQEGDRAWNVRLREVKREKTSIPAAHFRMPEGYQMLSEITRTNAISASKQPKTKGKVKQRGQDEDESLTIEVLRSVINIITFGR